MSDSPQQPDVDSKALDGPHPEERPEPTGKRNAQGIRIDPEAEAEPEPEVATLSVLVLHEPGVLAQISSLFSRRQFNIESLTVGPTENPDRARITLVIEETRPGIEQAKKQLAKLVPVASVRELERDATLRELALIKVSSDHPDKVQSMAEMYGGQAVDAGAETITVEITGQRPQIENAVEAFERFGVREVTRTGTAALARGTTETAAHDHPANAPMNDD
ncbi:acetolactate synthase small subunit [Salinarchaeum sp. Harcht-Bsk1]|uniref:acetolactate synthase small subunit n=1 Tax=Salinarchaeum sp. Harcht-Bsk1 TaxID=1333523 RepID=UPI0003422974|nr:acetolactate synthase small subunit [Salinarchaeum sp. Harcht-Bsk1]AGN00114.1 acetolactate synthase small subunit [Salinarchaeum sp. Harcht-Bsk1]